MNPETNKLTRRDEQLPERTHNKAAAAPLVDIYENNDEILLLADMPGVTKESLEVRLDHEKLSLYGRALAPQQGGLLVGEFHETDYERTFLVPQLIDVSQIRAELECGVLTVHLPKAAAAKPRQIPVQAG